MKKYEIFSASPKAISVFMHAYRHSRRVRFLKIVLPTTGIILALVFSWLVLFSLPRSTNSVLLSDEEKQDNKLVMTTPRIEGYTSDNKLYSLTAAKAIQDHGRAEIIEMQHIRAILPFGEEEQAAINAQTGIFNNTNGHLEIPHPFVVENSDGMIARLLSADINIRTNQMTTNNEVAISRENDFLTANSMHVFDNGQRILFNGKVRLVVSIKQ
ncbi:MAG: lipopolysaccharide export system protein LptC [Candidatus Tokpelaia sp. JSC188]|nr:MAG: lipopolysaccharide export system protein LptC [Candidatus Tokpelaia sp. JSC188]